jgi:GAF domain-containing protein
MAADDMGHRRARGSGGQSPDIGLARDLSELARDLQAESSIDALLQRVVDASVAEIDGAEFAGISEIDGSRVHTRAASGPLAQQLDEIQYHVQEGPCLSSLRDEVTVRSDDLRTDTRWPQFTRGAVAAGVRSMLSVQLFVEGNNLGALNLYSCSPDAFDDNHESIAMLLASHAAIAMRGSSVETNLRTALATRDIIGQAKGILMERYKINGMEAFDLLVRASQQTHHKLRELAQELADTGHLRIP